MKQKIVLKVQMNGQKCQTKAMQIAASAGGVISVAIDGEKQQVVVVGDGVDKIEMATLLRNKVGHTDIISVEKVQEEEKKAEVKKPDDPRPKS